MTGVQTCALPIYRLDNDADGFQWVDCSDADNSTYSLLRVDGQGRAVLVVINATPIPRPGFRVGVPGPGRWDEVLNSDAQDYFGSGWGNYGGVEAERVPFHGRPYSLNIALPPLSVVYFRGSAENPR